MKMEELSRKSFCQNGIISAVLPSEDYHPPSGAPLDLFTNDGWSRSIEWEARIPPINQESTKLELHDQFMKNHEYYSECHNRLMEINQDLVELDELLTRCDPQSLEYAKIEMALLQLYHDTSFKQELELYEDLRAKLSTIHQRVSDWECRQADVGSNLSDSQTSLDESHSSSSSSSSSSLSPDIQLPPVPELIPNLFRKTPSITSPSASRANQTMSAMLSRSSSTYPTLNDFERVRLAEQIWQKQLNPDADQFVPRQAAANNLTSISPTLPSHLSPNAAAQSYPNSSAVFYPNSAALQTLLAARHQFAHHQLQQLYYSAAASSGIIPTPLQPLHHHHHHPHLFLSHKGGGTATGKFGGHYHGKQQQQQFHHQFLPHLPPTTAAAAAAAAYLLTGASLAPFPSNAPSGFFCPPSTTGGSSVPTLSFMKQTSNNNKQYRKHHNSSRQQQHPKNTSQNAKNSTTSTSGVIQT